MNTDDKERIAKLREKYLTPHNQGIIDDMESKFKNYPHRKEFLSMDMTKEVIDFLRKRIVDHRYLKANDDNLTIDDLKLINVRISECLNVLRFLSPNIESEIASLREEADKYIAESNMD